MRRTTLLAAAVACSASWAIAAPAVAPPMFELTVLPPLVTPDGESDRLLARDINGRGQVVGTAGSSDGSTAVFRYTPGVGMEDLDPDGRYRSAAWAINDRGQVFGATGRRSGRLRDLFLFSDESGFDFLDEGKTPAIRETFLFRGVDLPRSGEILGSVREDSRLVPYLYSPDEGWRDLSGLHPRFEQEDTAGVSAKAGRYIFTVLNHPLPGEQPPFQHSEAFVLLRSGELKEIESPGRPVVKAGRINRSGRIAGLYIDDRAQSRAYVFTPAGGLVDVHPRRFRESFATEVLEDGTVVGMAKRGREYKTIFLYTGAEGSRVLLKRQLRRLARRRDLKLESVDVEDVNNRGEIVGCIYSGPAAPNVPFYYSPEHGLYDLWKVTKGLGTGAFRARCGARINDASQILLDGRASGEGGVAILSVVSG